MKHYRFLVPVILIVLFAASIYMLGSAKAEEENTYNDYLSSARKNLEMGILVDAEADYLKAAELRSSAALYQEIGDFYENAGEKRKLQDWGEKFAEEYPLEPAGYEFLIRLALQTEDYVACFEWSDVAAKRGVQSDYLTQAMQEIEWLYYLRTEFDDVGSFSGGRCAVQQGGYWSYVNNTGSLAVKNTYRKAGGYYDSIAPVVTTEGEAYYIDEKGNKKFVTLGLDNVTELGVMVDGIYPLKQGDVWGYYDKEYTHLFGAYEEASALANGVAAVKTDGKWQLVDGTGKPLNGNTYDGVLLDGRTFACLNGRIFVEKNGLYHMLDATGNEVSAAEYQGADVFRSATYAAVKISGRWGFVDQEGTVVIEPQYEEARSFSNGLAAVKQKGKWGFIDQNGTMVLQPEFEDARDFNSSGCAFVRGDDEWELLCLYKTNH